MIIVSRRTQLDIILPVKWVSVISFLQAFFFSGFSHIDSLQRLIFCAHYHVIPNKIKLLSFSKYLRIIFQDTLNSETKFCPLSLKKYILLNILSLFSYIGSFN